MTLYEANSAVCPTCSASASVSIGGEYDRWRLSRSLGGIKTDEVFARLLLNLWENNRKFINVSRRSAVGGDTSSATSTKQELPEPNVGAESSTTPMVDVKGKPIVKTEGNDAASVAQDANDSKRRRTSMSPVPPLPPPSKAKTTEETPQDSNPAREVRKILSPSNTRVPKKADVGGRAKRQIGRPKKFDDFTLLRHSTSRRSSDDAVGSPVGAFGSGGGSFAAARSALASVTARSNQATTTTNSSFSCISLSSGRPLVPSPNPEHSGSGSKTNPSTSLPVISCAKTGSRLTFVTSTVSASSGLTPVSTSTINTKEANERLIQRCIRDRGVSLPVKERNCLSKSLDDGALNVEQKTEIVGIFLRQFDETTNKPSSSDRSVKIKDEESNDSLSPSWTPTEENVKSDNNDEQDHENLIDQVLKEKEMTHRHLHYLKRAKLRALLREDNLKPVDDAGDDDVDETADVPLSRRQRRRLSIVEAFLTEIISKTRRLDAVIAGVAGTTSLDGPTRSKLTQKLKKRVLENDDDVALTEVVWEFMSDVKSHTSYFLDAESGHGKSGSKRRSDSFEWSRVLNDDSVIVNVDSSQPSISHPKVSVHPTSIHSNINSQQNARLSCKQCMKTCRDGRELQWHMRSTHDEIDAQVCLKCFLVFYTLARLKSHECDCDSDSSDDDDDDSENAESLNAQNKQQVANVSEFQNQPSTVSHSPSAHIKTSTNEESNDAEKENSPTTSVSPSPCSVRQYRHPNQRSGPLQLHCPYPNCNAVLASNSSLWTHKRRHRATAASSPKAVTTGRFLCSSCPYRSHSNIFLANHVTRNHGKGIDSAEKALNLKGRVQPRRVFDKTTEDEAARVLKRRNVKGTSDTHLSQQTRQPQQSSRQRRPSKQTLPKIPTGDAVADGSFRPVVLMESHDRDWVKDNASKDSFAFYVGAEGWRGETNKRSDDDDGEETEAGTDDEVDQQQSTKHTPQVDQEASDTSEGETETYSDVYFDDVHEYEGEEEEEEQTDEGEEFQKKHMETHEASPEELREKDGGRQCSRKHSEEIHNVKLSKTDDKELPDVLEGNVDDEVFATSFMPEGSPVDVASAEKPGELIGADTCVADNISEASQPPIAAIAQETDGENQTCKPTSVDGSAENETLEKESYSSEPLDPNPSIQETTSIPAINKSCVPSTNDETTSKSGEQSSELTTSGLPSFNIFQTFARRKSPSDFCLLTYSRERSLEGGVGGAGAAASRSDNGVALGDIMLVPDVSNAVQSIDKTHDSNENGASSFSSSLASQSIPAYTHASRQELRNDASSSATSTTESSAVLASTVDSAVDHEETVKALNTARTESGASTIRCTASLLPASTVNSSSMLTLAASPVSSLSSTEITDLLEEPYLVAHEEGLTVTKAINSSPKVYGKPSLPRGSSASIPSSTGAIPKAATDNFPNTGQYLALEPIGGEVRQITISTSPIKTAPKAVLQSTSPVSDPSGLERSCAVENAEYEMLSIDIAEEVYVNNDGSISTDSINNADNSDHERMIESLSQLNPKSLQDQLPSEYTHNQEAAQGSEQQLEVDGSGTTFAFHYESSALGRIVATNCDHDYSSPGHCEIFVSVLTKDNKKIKFVIE